MSDVMIQRVTGVPSNNNRRGVHHRTDLGLQLHVSSISLNWYFGLTHLNHPPSHCPSQQTHSRKLNFDTSSVCDSTAPAGRPGMRIGFFWRCS